MCAWWIPYDLVGIYVSCWVILKKKMRNIVLLGSLSQKGKWLTFPFYLFQAGVLNHSSSLHIKLITRASMENARQAETHPEGILRCRNVILFLYNQSININRELGGLALQAALLPRVFLQCWQSPVVLLVSWLWSPGTRILHFLQIPSFLTGQKGLAHPSVLMHTSFHSYTKISLPLPLLLSVLFPLFSPILVLCSKTQFLIVTVLDFWITES